MLSSFSRGAMLTLTDDKIHLNCGSNTHVAYIVKYLHNCSHYILLEMHNHRLFHHVCALGF